MTIAATLIQIVAACAALAVLTDNALRWTSAFGRLSREQHP